MIREVQPEPIEGAMHVTFDMQDACVGDEFVVSCPPLATIRRLSIEGAQPAPPPGERELPIVFTVDIEFDQRPHARLDASSTGGCSVEFTENELFVPEGAAVRLRFRIRTMPGYWPPSVRFVVQLVGRQRCTEHGVDNQGCCHQCGVLMDRQLWELYAGKGAPFP